MLTTEDKKKGRCKFYINFIFAAPDANKELDSTIPPMAIDPAQFKGSLHHGKDDNDTNCWTAPSGEGFMIRGKNYLKDNSKVVHSFQFPKNCMIQSPILVVLD